MSAKKQEKKKITVRMTEEEIWRFVEDGHTGILTTLRKDGVPVALPIWYACINHIIYIRTRGKKLMRIQNDPRSSFLVEDGEHWAKLRAVHMTGRADIVNLNQELSRLFRAEINRKYSAYRTASAAMPQKTQEAYAKSVTGVVRFTPDERILNWDNAKLLLD